jgi:hypothetical protein
MIKYTHGIKNWDTHFTVPTFEFLFKFPIPGPNKEKVTTNTDSVGRIISSKAPVVV